MTEPTLLLENAFVVPIDGPPGDPAGSVRTADVRLAGAVIAAIGDLEPRAGEIRIDCSGLVAIPGFVQGHVHFCQTLFRGLADDLPLLDWLRTRIWPMEAAHDARSVRASAELSIQELLRGGTTTVQVMETVRHTEESFDCAARSGMTAILGNCLMDRPGDGVPAGLATGTAEALDLTDELRRQFHGRGRLRLAVSPRFLLSCSDELGRDAAAFAAQHGLSVHTHAGEHRDEVAAVRRRFGADYLLVLREQGLLGARTGLAHCVHLTDEEHRALEESGAAVLHCPSANLKLGSGVAPIARYARSGVRIALGADGAPCNNRLSALTELRQAALLQCLAAGPGAWPAAAALYAATRGGAEALGLGDELGSIEPGKRADLVLLGLPAAQRAGPDGGAPDPTLVVSELVYAASERDIRHVICGGRFAVRDGEPVLFDVGRIEAEARGQRELLLQRAGLRA